MQTDSAASVLLLLAFMLSRALTPSENLVAAANAAAATQLSAITDSGLMPHSVTLPAAMLLSGLQLRPSVEPTANRRLLDLTAAQQQQQQQCFDALEATLNAVLVEELKGAAVGATLSLATANLTAQYLSTPLAALQRSGATCGAFTLPPGTVITHPGPPALLAYVLAKARPPAVRPWANDFRDIVTDSHTLTVQALSNGTAVAATPTLRPVADVPRAGPTPTDPELRSHCLELVDARWQRSVTIGEGMPLAQEYRCAVQVVNADPVAVVAVEDAPLVRVEHSSGPPLSVLLIIIIVLLSLLALLILMLVTIHYMRLRRARLHRIRIANAEKGEFLFAAPIPVGGKHFCFAGNMRTVPELVLFEDPL